jgi:hypothetical protein
MKLSENFSLSEFVKSGFADKYGIDNTPTPEALEYIKKLATEILQPIRDEFGEPIIVSSGYRCERVNNGIGGAKNSDHKYGAAVDIKTVTDTLTDNRRLWDCIIRMKDEGKLKCRQIIWEYGRRKVGSDWIHLSINNQYNSYKDNQIVYIGVK